jgi:hypothetical protein
MSDHLGERVQKMLEQDSLRHRAVEKRFPF